MNYLFIVSYHPPMGQSGIPLWLKVALFLVSGVAVLYSMKVRKDAEKKQEERIKKEMGL